MSETFTKLFGSITDSTIWAEDNATRLVWITMLAMADQDGYVGASIPGLANRARVSVAEVETALAKFLAPDPYSRSQDHEGRRIEAADRGWVLLNYDRFRDMRDEEVRKAYERERKRKQRRKAREAEGVPDNPGQSPEVPPGPAVSAQAEAEAEADQTQPPKPPEGGPRVRDARNSDSKSRTDRGGQGTGPAPDPKPPPDVDGARPGFEELCETWRKDPMRSGFEAGPLHKWPEILELAAEFDRVLETRTRIRPNHPAARAAAELGADGVTLDEMREAFEGAALDPYLLKNPQFRTMQTVLRDAGQIDKYRALREAPDAGDDDRTLDQRKRARAEQNARDERQWTQALAGAFGDHFRDAIKRGEITDIKQLREAMRKGAA